MPLVDLCQSLQHLQTRAEALGHFVAGRDLLDGPTCGLFEDVTVEGLLITSREPVHPPIDIGLRFREVFANTFQCPACPSAISLKKQDHGEAK